jgi:hypothetical protein
VLSTATRSSAAERSSLAAKSFSKRGSDREWERWRDLLRGEAPSRGTVVGGLHWREGCGEAAGALLEGDGLGRPANPVVEKDLAGLGAALAGLGDVASLFVELRRAANGGGGLGRWLAAGRGGAQARWVRTGLTAGLGRHAGTWCLGVLRGLGLG